MFLVNISGVVAESGKSVEISTKNILLVLDSQKDHLHWGKKESSSKFEVG